MSDDSEVISLLREIRDVQRQHLETYKQFISDTATELQQQRALQEDQVRRLRANSLLYRAVLVVSAIIVSALLYYLVNLDLRSGSNKAVSLTGDFPAGDASHVVPRPPSLAGKGLDAGRRTA